MLTWCGKQVPIPFRDEVQKGSVAWLHFTLHTCH